MRYDDRVERRLRTKEVLTIPTGRSMADEAVRRGAIDLAQGVLHAEPPPVLLELLAEVSRQPHAHVYASPRGVPEYLEALADLLRREGVSAAPANILGSSGNTGGLMAALLAHCNAGDRVLLPEPFYPAHLWAIRAARCEPVFLECTKEFSPEEDNLRHHLQNVRAAIICNPANPSGAVWPRALLESAIDIARGKDVLLIVDETYKDYVWEGSFISPLTLTDDWRGLVVLRSFSKTLAIAGWRAGYTISAPERIAAMTHQIHDALYVGAPSLPQLVLTRALRTHRAELDRFVTENVARYRESRTQLADVFHSVGMEPVLPQGTFYMLVKHNRESDIAATTELLDAGVAVAPGQAFFQDPTKPSGTIRIHFAVSPETVEEVRKRLAPLRVG
ncbi:MAG: aminotransferase, class I/II superfamily protein [Parcubacteria group bacterium Gr01-1014_38]|nr:MAG: aminotransferase, class I/II superfamily protein [Parcubacteria group bacterium Gr01-1014_38]